VNFFNGNFLFMLINFIILMLFLVRFLYRPIQGILEQRSKKIAEDLETAEKSRESAERLHHEAKIVLEEAHVEAYEIVERAKNEAERLRDEIINQARQETDQLRQRLQLEIERAKRIARDEIREEAVTMALTAVSKILGNKMSTEINDELIRGVITEIEKGVEQDVYPGSA